MGSTLKTSPNASSSPKAKPAKAPTAIALGVVAALLGGALAAGPASAKTTVQGGQNACKAAFAAQTPAPSSFRIDGNETRAQADTLTYGYQVKTAGADKPVSVTCTVDRNTNVATLTPEAAPATTLAAR